MKTFKFLMPFLLVAFTFVGCNTDDLRNDIDELKNRVESLEALVSTMNDNVNALKVFAEGGVTISSYEKVGDTYKLVLSDGRTIELTQGKQGDVDVPTIGINEKNEWVVQGEAIVGSVAKGEDAKAPEFSIEKYTPTGGTEGYYWFVDGKLITDELGNPVSPSSSGSVNIKPDFFESVTVSDDGLSMEIQLRNPDGTLGEKYSLPIVQGLICKIETEGVKGYENNILSVGFGESVTLNVQVTGENKILTVPTGWTASLSTLDTEGKGTLTITAPKDAAATSRAAVADNTKDLVLQTNKGIEWAVAKIQVEAKQLIESYYQEYLNGKDLVIGKVGEDTENAFVLNKTTCPESMVQYIESDQDITEDNKVYFVKEGVTVTYNVADKINTMIIVGDKPGVKPIVKTKKILSLSGTTSGKGLILYNIVLDATEHTNYVINIDGNTDGVTYDYLYLIDNCRIKLPTTGANLSFINKKSSVSVSKTAMCNTYVQVPVVKNKNQMLLQVSGEYKFSQFIMFNNVFYALTTESSPQTFVDAFALLAAAEAKSMFTNVDIENNTFINLLGKNVYAKSVLKGTLNVKNNLIWNDCSSTTNTSLFQAIKESDLSQVTADNYSGNKLYSKNGLKAAVFHTNGNTPDPLVNNNLSNEAADPFTGGKMLWDEGVFVPGPGYETVGAHIE